MMDNEISAKVLIALRRIMRAVDLNSKKLQKHHQLTVPQLIILREIERLDESPIGSLARNASLSNATVTGIVDRLEKRGLVARLRNSNDRRQVLVKVTDEGLSVLKNAPSPLQEEFIKEFVNLDLSEQTNILRSLERVAIIMDAERIEVAPMLSGAPLLEIDHKNNNEGAQSEN